MLKADLPGEALPAAPLRTMSNEMIRTLAAWRSDLGGYRDVSIVCKIALKSLARRYLELYDEIADLDVMISVIVDELAPELIAAKAIGYEYESVRNYSLPLETIRND